MLFFNKKGKLLKGRLLVVFFVIFLFLVSGCVIM